MTIDVSLVPLEEILPLRELYRREMNCQIVHDSLPGRGFGDLFLLRVDGRVAGYGFVMGYRGEPRDLIREFYVLPAYRGSALPATVPATGRCRQGRRIVAQTNDVLLTLMLYDCASEITSETVVFHDAMATSLALPARCFRPVAEADKDRIFLSTRSNRVASGCSNTTGLWSRPAASPRTTTLPTATSSWRSTSHSVGADLAVT